MSMELLFSLALAGSASVTAEPPIPENLREIEEAQFSKKRRVSDIMNRKVHGLVRKNGCKAQDVSEVWDGMKVVALMLVNSKGNIEKITPISTGCPSVEEYGIKHLMKYTDKLTSVPNDAERKWYRTSVVYYW